MTDCEWRDTEPARKNFQHKTVNGYNKFNHELEFCKISFQTTESRCCKTATYCDTGENAVLQNGEMRFFAILQNSRYKLGWGEEFRDRLNFCHDRAALSELIARHFRTGRG